MPDEIRAFFDRYRDAFNALDSEAVARLYAVPSGILSGQQYTHWPAFEPIAENMSALCKLYAEHGFSSASYEPSALIEQGERCAVVDLSWVIERTDGQEPWRFNRTYNLLRTSEGWRVLLCTAYEEARLNA